MYCTKPTRYVRLTEIFFLPYIEEIQKGAVAKSFMTNGLLIYDKIFAHFLIQYIRKPFLRYGFATGPL
jgi:hypothetical protein